MYCPVFALIIPKISLWSARAEPAFFNATLATTYRMWRIQVAKVPWEVPQSEQKFVNR